MEDNEQHDKNKDSMDNRDFQPADVFIEVSMTGRVIENSKIIPRPQFKDLKGYYPDDCCMKQIRDRDKRGSDASTLIRWGTYSPPTFPYLALN